MGSSQSTANPQEDAGNETTKQHLAMLENSMKAMQKDVERASSPEDQLVSVLQGFERCVRPTKHILDVLEDRRAAGLPEQHKQKQQEISKEYQQVLFETLEFTPYLRKVFRSHITGIQCLRQVQRYGSVEAQQQSEKNQVDRYLQTARTSFQHAISGPEEVERRAEALADKWAKLQVLLEAEIAALEKSGKELEETKRFNFILACVAGVGAVLLVGLTVYLIATGVGAAGAAAAATAKAQAAATAAANAQAHAAAAATASFLIPDRWMAAIYQAQAAASIVHASSLTAQASAATSQAWVTGGAAVASFLGAAGFAYGAARASSEASQAWEQADKMRCAAGHALGLKKRYEELKGAATTAQEQVRMIMNCLANLDGNGKDLLLKLDSEILELLVNPAVQKQLEEHEKTLECLLDRAKELEQTCMQSLASWMECTGYSPSQIQRDAVLRPYSAAHPTQPEHSRPNEQEFELDNDSTVSSYTSWILCKGDACSDEVSSITKPLGAHILHRYVWR
eukprot:TRINITY_DN34053_c0_g1_i1.p1 TRINITY_DN34053_c0_g1~~TRINITY_DN34053_c0_g1_i1.p1  ORF type:complete len:511 (-),score=115.57 TRINITY_DN34053_c0_g1_i1:138-1670(-)